MCTNKTLYLFQNKDGYRFNSDTLVLYDFISKIHIKGAVLDIGSGCGILGQLIKRDFNDVSLTQIDIQPIHVKLTQMSALKNGLESSVISEDIRNYKFEDKFDYIVSNPPFYNYGSQKSKNSSLAVSRYADELPFDELCQGVSSNIKPRASFIFCYDAKQIDTVLYTLTMKKFKVNEIRFVHTKKGKNASLVLIHAKKSSKSLCKILPPLFMDSKEMDDIYSRSKTKSLLCQI